MRIGHAAWLGAMVACVALSGCSGKPGAAAQASPPTVARGAVQIQLVAAAVSSKLDRLFAPDVIGGTVAGFEAVSGPATRVLKTGGDADGTEERSYQVDGCPVTMDDARGVVDAVSLVVSTACTVPLHAMLPSAPDLDVSRLTFATLFRHGATDTMLACAAFAECGNYADPAIGTTLGGSRADGFLEVRFMGTITGDADTATLVDMMQAEASRLHLSNDGDLDAKAYNRDRPFMRQVEAKLGGVRMTSITLQSGA